MNNQTIEKVARAIRDGLAKWDKEDGSPPLTWEAMQAETPKMAEMYLVMARAAITAYNPDDRLREALEEAAEALEQIRCSWAMGDTLDELADNAINEARSALSPLPQAIK